MIKKMFPKKYILGHVGVNSSELRNAESLGENKKCKKLNDKKILEIFNKL